MPPLLLYRTPGWIRTNACTILSRVPLQLGYKGKVEQVGLEPTITEL